MEQDENLLNYLLPSYIEDPSDFADDEELYD